MTERSYHLSRSLRPLADGTNWIKSLSDDSFFDNKRFQSMIIVSNTHEGRVGTKCI